MLSFLIILLLLMPSSYCDKMKAKNSTVSLTKNSQKQLSTSTTEEPYNSKAMKNETLFGGDMVGVEVAKNDPIVDNGKSGKILKKAAAQPSLKWPNGILYYVIDSSLKKYKPKILQAFKHIEQKTCIRFKPRSNQKDYVKYFDGIGCYSSVGRVGGRQYLSLDTGCHDLGSILHETMHAIGFYHEHMRTDRDNFIKINWQNIEPGSKEQFDKIPKSQMKLYTTFDYKSITIYGQKAFSKNGKDTMVPLKKGARMIESHFKNGLSQSDVTAVRKMYNCNKKKTYKSNWSG